MGNKEIFLITLFVTSFLFILASLYFKLNLKRIDEVYKIRTKWIDTSDYRYYKYTYDQMLRPSSKNLFGLKMPKESDFKF
jgi:hypothetical protein